MRVCLTTCLFMLLGIAGSLASPARSLGQYPPAPVWSRSMSFESWSLRECLDRGRQALQAGGYTIDWSGGDVHHGYKGIHSAFIMCDDGPQGKIVVNIVVSSNSSDRNLSGVEWQRLREQMGRPVRTSGGGGPAPPPPTGGKFPNPTINGYPISNCLDFGGVGCGQPAADTFCRAQGFSRATSYSEATRPGMAWIQGRGMLCNDPGCGAITDLICASDPRYVDFDKATEADLTGDWNLLCCNDAWGWTLSITNQQRDTFSGSMAGPRGGKVTNGLVRGNTIEFDRLPSDCSVKQHWVGQLVSDSKGLRIINGSWTGCEEERYQGRTNWHAEKKK